MDPPPVLMPATTTSPGPDELSSLRQQVARLEAIARRRGRLLGITACALLALSLAAASGVVDVQRQLASCRTKLVESRESLSALARRDAGVTPHTATAADGVSEPWSDHFTITMYTARSAAYGRTNDGFTATMTKADPARRIVAVDPRMIPYRSKVWIDGLGWYTAEDCGGAIKGLKLDVMAHSHGEAMQFGRQRRRVIVLPPGTGSRA